VGVGCVLCVWGGVGGGGVGGWGGGGGCFGSMVSDGAGASSTVDYVRQ